MIFVRIAKIFAEGNSLPSGLVLRTSFVFIASRPIIEKFFLKYFPALKQSKEKSFHP
jgi:hypothetical protein